MADAKSQRLTVAETIFQELEKMRIGHVFLLPGGGCMYLVDALERRKALTPITLLHEQSVGIAAEAYGQFTNKLAVALVTTGPGGTNALTACAAAWTDSTPVLFLSGQVKTSDISPEHGPRQLGFQEIPITRMVAPITKAAVTVKSSTEALKAFYELIKLSSSGRPGPVWLDIPLDIQNSPVGNVSVDHASIHFECDETATDVKLVAKEIIECLKNSSRPLILLGNGVRLAGAISDAKKLIETLEIPVLLSWKMMDFLAEDDALNMGRPGSIPQPWSNTAQQQADFILSLGARLDTGQTAYNLQGFGMSAKKIVVDVDYRELSKFPTTSDFSLINCDAKRLIAEIISNHLPLGVNKKWNDWRKEIAALKSLYAKDFYKRPTPNDGVNLYNFLDALSDVLGPNAIVVPGSSGACSEVTMQAYKVKAGQRIFNSEGLGPMGFAIPASLAAVLASGGQRVISIDGDGGFFMNIQDLASVKKHADNIVFFVLNNDGYGSIKNTQDRYFSGRRLGSDEESGLALINLRSLAKTFDLVYEKIDTETEMADAILRAVSGKGTYLVEVKVESRHRTSPRVISLRDEQGNPLPSNMERFE